MSAILFLLAGLVILSFLFRLNGGARSLALLAVLVCIFLFLYYGHFLGHVLA